MRNFNVNEIVWVKLTKEGEKLFLTYINKLRRILPSQYLPTLFQGGDIYSDSLWQVMEIFSPGFRVGGPPLFERNVIHFENPEKVNDMILVGTILYGYCGGHFGRDDYSDKRVEAVGSDWIVAREIDSGRVCFASGKNIHEDLLSFTTEPEG